MKKTLLIGLLCLCLQSISIHAEDLSGVWYRYPVYPTRGLTEMELSWGSVTVVINASFVIDNLSDIPIIRIEDQGYHGIKSIEQKTDELYILVFYFDRGQFDVECRIHLLTEDCMWIEPTKNATLFGTGEDHKWYRLSKPPRTNTSTHITTENLRIQEKATTTSPIVTTLDKGSKIQVLETMGSETIDDITAPWVKVVTSTGIVGWCFSGHLEKL